MYTNKNDLQQKFKIWKYEQYNLCKPAQFIKKVKLLYCTS